MKNLLVAVCVLDDVYSRRAMAIVAELGAQLVVVQFPPEEECCSGNRSAAISRVVEEILATKADVVLYQVHHTHIGLEIRNELLGRRVGMDVLTISSGSFEGQYRSSKVGTYLWGSAETEAVKNLETAKMAVQEAEAHLDNVRSQMLVARQRNEQRLSVH